MCVRVYVCVCVMCVNVWCVYIEKVIILPDMCYGFKTLTPNEGSQITNCYIKQTISQEAQTFFGLLKNFPHNS